MLRMSTQIETIVNAYKTLSKIPSIVGGKLNNSGNKISAKWSVRNLDKGKTTKYTHDYVLDKDLNVIHQSDFGVDVSNELMSAVSSNGMFKALIREERESKESKKQYLEVWCHHNLAHCIDLTALDLHGDVYADSEFGCLDWTQDESAVVYVAEKKLKKSEPYIKRKSEDKSKVDGSGENAPKKGEEFIYRQDWGEQLVGKHLSVVVVCRLATETFTILEGLPESWCPGQIRFSNDGQSVYGVAWETEPRRLGLIFCTNRPSFIFNLTLDGKLTKISAEGMSVRSPRLSASGDLFWLQRAADGPHHACHALMIKRKDSAEVSTLIDIVQTEVSIANGENFYGLYNQALPVGCFASEGRILFSTPQQNEIRSYVVDTADGRIVDISNKSVAGSTVILDVKSDVILAYCSNMTTPAQLYVCKLPERGNANAVIWKRVGGVCDVPAQVTSAKVTYMYLKHDTDEPVKSFTALYFEPKIEGQSEEAKMPLIVWPHGGPHSGFVNAYSLEAAFFAMLGFAALRVNFRGSTGQGDMFLRSLISHAGSYDVRDCLLALTHIQERDARFNDVLLYGGSYGGFAAALLAGKYPDMFKSVVLRNPLIDLATKGHYADNSDGCAVEAGFPFTEQGPLSEEQLLAMRRCSPLTLAHCVKAPTALMLGSGDKRVPHFQGLEYSRRLKANGVKTRVYMYDDNHSLSSLPAEMDNLINSADWFLTHI